MTNEEYFNLFRNTVIDYFNSRSDKTDGFKLSSNDVYIV